MDSSGATYIDRGELSLGGSKIAGGTVYSASTGTGGAGHNGVTQFLSVGDNVYISNIPDPIESDEAANKGYVDKKIASLKQTQSDWNQTDDTAVDYIKNKPIETTPEDIVEWMCEINVIAPVASSNGEVYTTNDGKILVL